MSEALRRLTITGDPAFALRGFLLPYGGQAESEVAPSRPDLRPRKECVQDANIEPARLMILHAFAPIALRWPRDGAALLPSRPEGMALGLPDILRLMDEKRERGDPRKS